MEAPTFPRALETVVATLPRQLAENAVAALGDAGKASRALLEAGLVPPGALTPLTLHLLTNQPRAAARSVEATAETGQPSADADRPARSGGVAGGVWVREQVTYHSPVRIGEQIETSGEIARHFVRKGRQYSTTWSHTCGETGALLVSSCTTGLVQYRADPDLADASLGRAEDAIQVPGADLASAAGNPGSAALRALRVNDALVGEPIAVPLALMRALDGGRGANPIHTDPEAARAAGLSAPIAGGSHVLAFAQELMMTAWHPEVLLFGASFDVRWRVPVYAGQIIEPSVRVTEISASGVRFELEVVREGERAMVGSGEIPLA